MYTAVRVQWNQQSGEYLFEGVVCIKQTMDECLKDTTRDCIEHGFTPVVSQDDLPDEVWDSSKDGAPTIYYVHDEHGKKVTTCYGFKS